MLIIPKIRAQIWTGVHFYYQIFSRESRVRSRIFFASEADHAGTLRSVFWADGRAISSYLSFSDVIVFEKITRLINWTCPLLHSPKWININNLFCLVVHYSQMSKGICLFGFSSNSSNACTDLYQRWSLLIRMPR